ncbi:uncharacterized protein LOC123510641 isoform X2 [Portunus trituberculatus]|uniref:uncharacterized protein LOC123510641 isoform X2 n=1 Tax=Portunus trituberculatus TaxID=210409 RepID=UPI001E1D16BC|nr:uncharacterized protein LOC123510641 isoform X2 [Portunus trituberculatus]
MGRQNCWYYMISSIVCRPGFQSPEAAQQPPVLKLQSPTCHVALCKSVQGKGVFQGSSHLNQRNSRPSGSYRGHPVKWFRVNAFTTFYEVIISAARPSVMLPIPYAFSIPYAFLRSDAKLPGASGSRSYPAIS